MDVINKVRVRPWLGSVSPATSSAATLAVQLSGKAHEESGYMVVITACALTPM